MLSYGTVTGRAVWQAIGMCMGTLALAVALSSAVLAGAGYLSDARARAVDTSVTAIMIGDNVPAVSLAVVLHGRIVYLKAYGRARLPDRRASTATRFGIGSITKQFTAAAVLLLVDRHKLSLDDRVGKFLPDLTDANNITVRELLSHTSGYEDYLSQEYLPARVQQPTSVDAILSNWGKRPLDFEPASQWQYSGTNYVIAGRIIERVTGQSYEKFLTENVLKPVGITDAAFIDESPAEKNDAVGYYRFGIGPPRVAPVAGRDWLFAMADLVMTARDVALWDLSVRSNSPRARRRRKLPLNAALRSFFPSLREARWTARSSRPMLSRCSRLVLCATSKAAYRQSELFKVLC